MKKLIYLGLLFLGTASCTVEPEELNEGVQETNLSYEYDTCGEMTEQDFGDAGSLRMWTEDEILYVEFTAHPGRKLVQSRISFFRKYDHNFPENGMFPPGKIDNHRIHKGKTTTYIYEFPLSDFECALYNIVPWAVFTGGGTHYAGDIPGGLGNWSYFEYCINYCTEPPPPLPFCRTSFMRGNTTFESMGLHEEVWGWAEIFDVELDGYEKTLPFYADAFDNDLSVGQEVGEVNITYTPETGEVMVTINLFVHYLTEVNIYFDDNEAPTSSSPGDYGFHQFYPEGSYSFYSSNGNFWIIVQGEVCLWY